MMPHPARAASLAEAEGSGVRNTAVSKRALGRRERRDEVLRSSQQPNRVGTSKSTRSRVLSSQQCGDRALSAGGACTFVGSSRARRPAAYRAPLAGKMPRTATARTRPGRQSPRSPPAWPGPQAAGADCKAAHTALSATKRAAFVTSAAARRAARPTPSATRGSTAVRLGRRPTSPTIVCRKTTSSPTRPPSTDGWRLAAGGWRWESARIFRSSVFGFTETGAAYAHRLPKPARRPLLRGLRG
ncbi:MAG: hypothetical protein RLZZ450_4563 [Pseudomonadota bacterium]